jgi:hypothetical protein
MGSAPLEPCFGWIISPGFSQIALVSYKRALVMSQQKIGRAAFTLVGFGDV